MKKRSLIIVLWLIFSSAFGQEVPLFQDKQPVNIRISGSIKSIKKESNDTTFVASELQYEKSHGQWITLPTQERVRGDFRLKTCFFPPLKFKFHEKDVESTLFEGNKSLKLVMPCQRSSDNSILVRKEYLCYKFYEVLSSYYFKTRLANLALTETSKKKPEIYEILSFFVEDNSMVAKRSNGKIIEVKGIGPGAFDEKHSIRNDFFQYMIGNTDWSAVYQHNSNSMYVQNSYVPLSYDFDMSGFVNASYAHTDAPVLGTGDPRDRVYRGFCKSIQAMEEIRKEFLTKEAALHSIIDEQTSSFAKKELNEMHDYLNEFFEILKSDSKFKSSILDACRTK